MVRAHRSLSDERFGATRARVLPLSLELPVRGRTDPRWWARSGATPAGTEPPLNAMLRFRGRPAVPSRASSSSCHRCGTMPWFSACMNLHPVESNVHRRLPMELVSETAWNSARLNSHVFHRFDPANIHIPVGPCGRRNSTAPPLLHRLLPASSCKPLRRTTVQWRRVRVQPEKPSQSWQSLTPAGHLTVFFQGPGPFFTTCAAREMAASPTLPVMPPHTFFFSQRASPCEAFSHPSVPCISHR